MNVSSNAYLKGTVITLLGVLVLTPDSLLLRLITCSHWTTLFWRGLGFASALTVWVVLRYRAEAFRRLMGVRPLELAVAAVLALATTCFVTAVTHTAVASALVLYSTAPLFAALFSLTLLREAIPPRTCATGLLGLLAVIITVSDRRTGWTTTALDADAVGILAALGSAVCWGLVTTLRRLGPDTDFTPALALSGLMVAALAVPSATPLAVTAGDAAWLGILCLLVIPVSFALITVGPRHLPAPEVALLLLLEVVLAPLLVWLVIGERPTVHAVLGGSLLLSALAANILLGARRAPACILEEERDDRAFAA